MQLTKPPSTIGRILMFRCLAMIAAMTVAIDFGSVILNIFRESQNL